MTDVLLTLDEFISRFREWVVWYNTARPHQALGGRTPLEAWMADPAPITRYDDLEALRHALLRPLELRKVDKNGVSFRSRYYVDAGLDKFVGRKVAIGYIEERPEQIEIFDGNDWVCTAKWDKLLDAGDRERIEATRLGHFVTVSNINLAVALADAQARGVSLTTEPTADTDAPIAGAEAERAIDLILGDEEDAA